MTPAPRLACVRGSAAGAYHGRRRHYHTLRERIDGSALARRGLVHDHAAGTDLGWLGREFALACEGWLPSLTRTVFSPRIPAAGGATWPSR